MEANGKLDDNLLKGLFENGFMGIEIDEKYGGAGSSFMTSILAVEEISKVDLGVAVLVHIQNTLVNTLISRLGTEAQKEKYLTKLATSSVSSEVSRNLKTILKFPKIFFSRLQVLPCLNLHRAVMLLHSKQQQEKMDQTIF